MNNSKIWTRDLTKILKKVYKEANAVFPSNSECALIDLIEWLIRIPVKSRRIVHKSIELNKKILTPFEIKNLSDIEKIIIFGGDLKPYLGDITRAIRNRTSKNNDFFFSDWGLLHLHLGADFENKKTRVSRSKRVLMAKFTRDHAYFIDIANHGRGYPDVWGDISHLKLLHENWPDILEGRIMRDMIVDDREISSSDYIKLRNAGINTPIIINGEAFISPNLGIATDGSHIAAVDISLQIQRELDKAEANFREIEPTAEAFLVLKKDFSIGFLIPENNTYYCIYTPEDKSEIANFFMRLLSEVPLSTDKRYNEYITPKRIKL